MSSNNGAAVLNGVAPAGVVAAPPPARRGDVAIAVEGLGKAYTIAHNAVKHTTVAEAMMYKARHPFERPETETFWALKDVSFDVHRGDVVGIIGRNGAGKSTLLKLLSRITEPTKGRATLHGRVGSLLEVGTGFHPELTGRENVYLNGSILGMSRREIDRQFDAIVEFSGTERFLDTPVKRYSSGMYVRLAFGVAAHLNPEILIVDEVLAVGDAEFQKKCLGKMQDVASGGRTVLFVSHSMASVLQLCNRCVYLKGGQVVADGPASDVIQTYIQSGQQNLSEMMWTPDDAPSSDPVKLLAVRTLDADNQNSGDFNLVDSVTIEMEFSVSKPAKIGPSVQIYNDYNVCVFADAPLTHPEWADREYAPGIYRSQCVIPRRFLNDGSYDVTAILVRDYFNILVMKEKVVRFQVHEDGSGRGGYTGPWIGVVRPDLKWSIAPIGDVR